MVDLVRIDTVSRPNLETFCDCPLCHFEATQSYHQDENTRYLYCLCCGLVFVPKQFHLSPEKEKSRYDQHKNNPNDKGYRAFLSQLFDPVLAIIDKGAKGLDFGSGPGSTLSLMFAEQGYQVTLFDKFYANNPVVFNQCYDFITATEVLEHLSAPSIELNRLFASLKKSGVLAVMTQMMDSKIDFATWHYKNDPTHICFFSKKTMRYLAKQWDAKVIFSGRNVALFMA